MNARNLGSANKFAFGGDINRAKHYLMRGATLRYYTNQSVDRNVNTFLIMHAMQSVHYDPAFAFGAKGTATLLVASWIKTKFIITIL